MRQQKFIALIVCSMTVLFTHAQLKTSNLTFGDYSIKLRYDESNNAYDAQVLKKDLYNYNVSGNYIPFLLHSRDNDSEGWVIGFILHTPNSSERYTIIKDEGIILKTIDGNKTKLIPYLVKEEPYKDRTNQNRFKYTLWISLDEESVNLLSKRENEIQSITFNIFKEKPILRLGSDRIQDFYYDAKSIIQNKTWEGWSNRIIKIKKEPLPKNIREELDNYYVGYETFSRKERLREIGIMGYIDAIAKYCELKLSSCYNPLVPAMQSTIENSTVDDVLPFLNAGKDSYADIQFYYACVLSGNYTAYPESEEKLTKDNYKHLDLPKAKEYFNKYLNNPNRKERKPFGWSDEIIIGEIERVFPELVNNKK